MGMTTALIGGLIGSGLGVAGSMVGSLSQNEQMAAQGAASEAQARALRIQSDQQRRAAVALIFGDLDHCRQAYESERLARQLPPELRP